MLSRNLLLTSLAVTLICFCASCTTVSYNLSSEESRKETLSKRASKFQQALYWGDITKAGSFIHSETRDSLQAELREKKESRRIIESELTDVDLNNDEDTGVVSMRVKYYTIPRYIVKERFEDQHWKVKDGLWFLTSTTHRES